MAILVSILEYCSTPANAKFNSNLSPKQRYLAWFKLASKYGHSTPEFQMLGLVIGNHLVNGGTVSGEYRLPYEEERDSSQFEEKKLRRMLRRRNHWNIMKIMEKSKKEWKMA